METFIAGPRATLEPRFASLAQLGRVTGGSHNAAQRATPRLKLKVIVNDQGAVFCTG